MRDASEMKETIEGLQRGIFFSKRRIEDMHTPTFKNALDSPQSATRPALRKGRYARYIEEREEQERLAIAQATATNNKINKAVCDMSAIFDRLNKINGVLMDYYDAGDAVNDDAEGQINFDAADQDNNNSEDPINSDAGNSEGFF